MSTHLSFPVDSVKLDTAINCNRCTSKHAFQTIQYMLKLENQSNPNVSGQQTILKATSAVPDDGWVHEFSGVVYLLNSITFVLAKMAHVFIEVPKKTHLFPWGSNYLQTTARNS